MVKIASNKSGLPVKDSPRAFINLLKSGVASLNEAGAMLKRMVARDKTVIAKIREIDPTLPAGVLDRLLLVGEGKLLPELLVNRAPAFKVLQSMPVEVQKEVVKRGAVEVVDPVTLKSRRVPLAHATKREVAQAFDRKAVRSAEAQRAVLQQAPRPNGPVEEVEQPWVIRGGKCVVLRGCVLERQEIERILKALS